MRTDTYLARLVVGMLHRAPLGVMLALVLLAGGCRELETIKEALTPRTPHEAYAAALEGARLNRTALGRDWLAASRAALADATPVTLPYREVGYLDPAEASAVGYRLDLQRGQQLFVDVALPGDTLQVFVDLFEVPDDTSRSVQHVASADSTNGLRYEVRRTRSYVLRLQPELLRGGVYTITLQTDGSLRFPVAGADSRAIRSFFGAPRDGGGREHHGVDIFAARGTPVVAATDGYVTRVTTGGLGGKVVWMRDEARGQAYYYAHLDSQLVAPHARVQAGDTLGLVGNTGNARTTPPHLHFGIYSRGPVDPYPFVHMPREGPPDITADTSRLGGWRRSTHVRFSCAPRRMRRPPCSVCCRAIPSFASSAAARAGTVCACPTARPASSRHASQSRPTGPSARPASPAARPSVPFPSLPCRPSTAWLRAPRWRCWVATTTSSTWPLPTSSAAGSTPNSSGARQVLGRGRRRKGPFVASSLANQRGRVQKMKGGIRQGAALHARRCA